MRKPPGDGTWISRRAPRTLESMAVEPPSVATRWRRLRGPISRCRSSSSDSRPSNGNPCPSSATTIERPVADCRIATEACDAPAWRPTFTSDSCTSMKTCWASVSTTASVRGSSARFTSTPHWRAMRAQSARSRPSSATSPRGPARSGASASMTVRIFGLLGDDDLLQLGEARVGRGGIEGRQASRRLQLERRGRERLQDAVVEVVGELEPALGGGAILHLAHEFRRARAARPTSRATISPNAKSSIAVLVRIEAEEPAADRRRRAPASSSPSASGTSRAGPRSMRAPEPRVVVPSSTRRDAGPRRVEVHADEAGVRRAARRRPRRTPTGRGASTRTGRRATTRSRARAPRCPPRRGAAGGRAARARPPRASAATPRRDCRTRTAGHVASALNWRRSRVVRHADAHEDRGRHGERQAVARPLARTSVADRTRCAAKPASTRPRRRARPVRPSGRRRRERQEQVAEERARGPGAEDHRQATTSRSAACVVSGHQLAGCTAGERMGTSAIE